MRPARWLSGKESACQAGDTGSISGLGRSLGEGNGNPLYLFLPGKSHWQRSLEDYSPWGHKESDTAEQLNINNRQIDIFLLGTETTLSLPFLMTSKWVLSWCNRGALWQRSVQSLNLIDVALKVNHGIKAITSPVLFPQDGWLSSLTFSRKLQ